MTTVLKVLCCLSVREKWLPFLQTEAPLLEAALGTQYSDVNIFSKNFWIYMVLPGMDGVVAK